MPPRRQPARQAQTSNAQPDADVLAKRTKRHLDELERSNYAETRADDDEDEGRGAKRGARHAVSDRPTEGRAKRRKSSMNVRTAVLYRKSLAVLLDESGIAGLPPGTPTYLTAGAPPPRTPPRMLCSVCGYWGKYRCRKCAMPYCDLKCEGVHDETRCERRVL